LTARFGGEEFVTAIANGNISHFVSRLNDVRQQLMHRPVTTPQGELRLNISIGVSAVTKHSLTATLKQADEALYLAKQQGRNQVQLAG
ncbi:MAG: diguanylate cyclase, partial [Aquaspirillum sp.]